MKPKEIEVVEDVPLPESKPVVVKSKPKPPTPVVKSKPPPPKGPIEFVIRVGMKEKPQPEEIIVY